ncbi:hypothetical protein [Verminephrobacter eiseniae]|uniref:hypothetical protein n=1 Tax=Verminephrobacter eiseniae TaxID=364317 RepID=UPI0022372185|nr:hypothetical protein [Verminephrobacter eiseniae]
MKNIFKTSVAISAVSLAALLLMSCGGANNGDPVGPIAKLRLKAPIGSLTAYAGGGWSDLTEVRGGTMPYGVFNNVQGLETYVDDDGVLMFRARGAGGNGDITVYDSSLPIQQVVIKGATKAIPMACSSGATINLVPNESRKFTVMGGIAPYTINNANAGAVTASISGSTVTVTAKDLTATATSTVTVLDATGAFCPAITVTVSASVQTSPPLAVDPSKIESSLRTTSRTMIVSGGTPPYTVVSTDQGVATVSIAGSTITVNLRAQGSAKIVVTDSKGQTIMPEVSVTTVLEVEPDSYVINEDDTSFIKYLIGGTATPFTAMISLDDQKFITVSIVGKVLRVAKIHCVKADKTIAIDVYDANLLKQTVHLTIKNTVRDNEPNNDANDDRKYCGTTPE